LKELYRTYSYYFLFYRPIKSRILQKLAIEEIPEDRIIGELANKVTRPVFRKQANVDMFWFSAHETSFYLVNEDTATFHFSLMFFRANMFRKIFFKKVGQMISSGLVQRIETRMNQAAYEGKQKVKQSTPQQLTMNHLGICFLAILICLALSFLVFIAERLVSFYAKRVNKN
jgi:hypothetical protein